MEHRFDLVDVFGEADFSGNPLAVVHGATGIGTDEMQRITRWLNLSETAFLLPPTQAGADYRVRIFSPPAELPFAGHPTLGSCHAWLDAGGVARDPGTVVQECGAGLIRVRPGAGGLAFAAPPLVRSGPADAAAVEEVVRFLRLERSLVVAAEWVDNGPGWIAVLLDSADQVLKVEPVGSWPVASSIGVVGAHPAGSAVGFEVRAFFTDQSGSVREDPVTGSLNASVGQWLFASGRATASYVAAQGTRLGRSGRVAVQQDAAGQVWVGGKCATLSSGALRL